MQVPSVFLKGLGLIFSNVEPYFMAIISYNFILRQVKFILIDNSSRFLFFDIIPVCYSTHIYINATSHIRLRYRARHELNHILGELKLRSYVKTSGKSGLHVMFLFQIYIPMNRRKVSPES